MDFKTGLLKRFEELLTDSNVELISKGQIKIVIELTGKGLNSMISRGGVPRATNKNNYLQQSQHAADMTNLWLLNYRALEKRLTSDSKLTQVHDEYTVDIKGRDLEDYKTRELVKKLFPHYHMPEPETCPKCKTTKMDLTGHECVGVPEEGLIKFCVECMYIGGSSIDRTCSKFRDTCELARSKDGDCGVEGKHWEKRMPKPKLKNFTSIVFGRDPSDGHRIRLVLLEDKSKYFIQKHNGEEPGWVHFKGAGRTQEDAFKVWDKVREPKTKPKKGFKRVR